MSVAAALCLILGGHTVTLPVDHFTLVWTHSIEQTRWEEDYVLRGDRLILTEARIEGTGAGMEPPPNAVLRDGIWRYVPDLPPLPALRLTLSSYTTDYRLCWHGQCRPLATLADAKEPSGTVIIRSCRGRQGPAPATTK